MYDFAFVEVWHWESIKISNGNFKVTSFALSKSEAAGKHIQV